MNAAATDIQRQVRQYYDVLYLSRDKAREEVSAFLPLVSPDSPIWRRHQREIEDEPATKLLIGEYRVSFVIVGDNVDATYYEFIVRLSQLSGREPNVLSEDDFRKSVTIAEIKAIAPSKAYSSW